MPRSSSVRPSTAYVYSDTINGQRGASLTPPQRHTSEDIKKQVRESLGIPPKPEVKPQVAVEGHVCDVPLSANQDDQLIIEGYPVMQDTQHVLLAQSCVSMLQQRVQKQAQQQQMEPPTP